MNDNALMPQQTTPADVMMPGVGGARGIVGVAGALNQATGGGQNEQLQIFQALSQKIDQLQAKINSLVGSE